MLPTLLNTLGGVPDLMLRNGLLLDGQRNGLARDVYLERLAFYTADRFQQSSGFFEGLPDVAPAYQVEHQKPFQGGDEILFRFPSQYQARNPALREPIRALKANRDAYLFLWRHSPSAPRPLVLCVHGFQMGHPQRAMRMFKCEKLFRAGADVALVTLPHHWRRADRPANPFRQRFINPHDVPLTIEALGQSVWDLRSSIRLLQSLGYGKLGLIGASLGGYISALYAAVDAEPAFTFVAVPALRLDRTLAPRRRKLGFAVDDELSRLSRKALRVVAPANYRPKMPVENIAAVYHGGDRIADAEYTREWIAAWRIPNVTTLNGGHWAVFDGKARGRVWYQWLARYGFLCQERLSTDFQGVRQ